MMAAAETTALRFKDFPSTKHIGQEIDNKIGFHLLDKNKDGKINIEELMEVMEELGADGDDAWEMMRLLDSNSDGFLSSDEFCLFQRQVEILQNLDDKDAQYKTILSKKLQMADTSRLIPVYINELGDKLVVN